MQTDSGNESSRGRVKANGKTTSAKSPKRVKAGETGDTLRLKTKHPIATEPTSPTADVSAMIATAAYYRAAQRGFEPGHELDDWLQAEEQVRSHLPS